MPKLIGVLLLLSFLAPAGVAQTNLRGSKSETAQRKAQAIDILKGVVESAADIEKTRTRVIVLRDALHLLWKHDEAYARANFIKFAATLSDKFASNTTSKSERSEIRASIGALLKAFARHDPQAAARLLEKFQKLLEDVTKGTLSPTERLSLAQSSLETDAVQSAALAAKVLEEGLPGTFPAYLNELEQRDAATAAALFRTALSIIAGGRIYSPVQVTVLSTYVFREEGEVYGVNIEVSKFNVWLPLQKFDLSYCFEQGAKRDWTGALAAAQSIESKVLRSQAYIAACRTIL